MTAVLSIRLSDEVVGSARWKSLKDRRSPFPPFSFFTRLSGGFRFNVRALKERPQRMIARLPRRSEARTEDAAGIVDTIRARAKRGRNTKGEEAHSTIYYRP